MLLNSLLKYITYTNIIENIIHLFLDNKHRLQNFKQIPTIIFP
jgi:hypothetical protein